MADATGVNSTLPTRIGGVSSTSGLPDYYADVLSTGNLKIATSDGSGNEITSTPIGPTTALDVSIAGSTVLNVDLAGLPNFQTSQQIVGTTAVQIAPTPLANRSSIGLKVTTTSNSDAVYFGNSAAVTTSGANGGYALFGGDAVEFDLTPSTPIWAIGTSPGQLIYIIEIGGT